jgi:glyoxylase-like metal-dependent hydrolase (beta-lactamase superfamily II)
MTAAVTGSTPGSALTAQLVKTGIYVISGGGCNSVLRLSANGFVLVDGQLPGNYDALIKKIQKISYSDQPVRALILTDHLEPHTGNNARFLEDGTLIIAQENVKQNLAGAKVPPPTITYGSSYKLHLGGVDVQLFHFGNAHTNGDTVVYFPVQKVVAVGDLYSQPPDPDYSAGGSLVSWGSVLAKVLQLDFDVVVPGKGPGVSRAGLEAFKTQLDTVVSRARSLVKKGVPKDQLMAQLTTADLGWRLTLTPDQLDHFYTELSQNTAAPAPRGAGF